MGSGQVSSWRTRAAPALGWAPVAVVGVAAAYGAVLGLESVTDSAVIALAIGLGGPGALVLVSLGLAHEVGDATDRTSGGERRAGMPRWLRRAGLGLAFVVMFGLCWLLAFWAYDTVFLAQRDEAGTIAARASRLAEGVLAPLRREVEARSQASASEMREQGPAAAYSRQLGDIIAGRRPEPSAVAEARQRDAVERQRLRADLTRRRGEVEAQRSAVERDVATLEQALTAGREELAALPRRIVDLRRALVEEQTGVLPALPAGPEPAAQSTPAGSAVLRPDGLAAALVREPGCRAPRQPGAGLCHRALEIALEAAGPRERELLRLIPQQEDRLSALRDGARSLPGELAAIDRQLGLYPALPQPGNTGRDDIGGLSEARDRFAQDLTEAAFITLADRCSPIVATLRTLPPAERPAQIQDVDCRPAAVLDAVADRERRLAVSRDVASLCGSAPTAQRIEAIITRLRDDNTAHDGARRVTTREERLTRALGEVRSAVIHPCLAAASLTGVTIEPFARTASDLEQRVSRRTDPDLAFGAVWQVVSLGANGTAALSAGCAFAHTALLALLAFLRRADLGAMRARWRSREATRRPGAPLDLAPREDDPPDVAGARWLLSKCRARPDGSADIVASFAALAPPGVRPAAQQLLGTLLRAGQAQAAPFGDRISLTAAGIAEAERIVETNDRSARASDRVSP